MLFNMQRSIGRFLETQIQLSTGRKLNKPSDDPVGIQRDLIYRTEITKTMQYRKNIHLAQTWTNNYDSILSDLKEHVTRAKELALAMADETLDDDTARQGAAEEVESIFDSLIRLANSEIEGKYVFSGFRTDQEALVAVGNGVVYNGDAGRIDYQIDNAARVTTNLLGSDVFLKPLVTLGEHADLNVGVTTGGLVADLHNGLGIDQATGTFTITDENLGITSTIDISAATTVQDVLDGINNQLAADGITNLQAVLGIEGNNILLDSTLTGQITDVTSLDSLHHGSGVDMSAGRILVTDGAGINIEVDFSDAATIGDLRAAFDSALAAAGYPQVTMSINPAGTGLQIDDASGVLGFRIADVSPHSTLALGLGITGDIDPTLVGADLEPAASFNVEETTGTIAGDLGILARFRGDLSGNDLDPRLLASSNLSDLKNRLGMDLDRIAIHQGNITRIIDLGDPTLITVQDLLDKINGAGLDVTASINPDGRGIQVVNDDPARSLIIDNGDSGSTAKDMDIWGSSDVMGSVLLLANSLRGNDQDGAGRILEHLDHSIEHLLTYRASTGTKGIQLESTLTQIEQRELSFTSLLSEVEDADITRVATELAMQENMYRASLMAGARIIQPSLLDFLR